MESDLPYWTSTSFWTASLMILQQYQPVKSNKVCTMYTPMDLAVWVVGMLALVCLVSDAELFPLHDALEVADW